MEESYRYTAVFFYLDLCYRAVVVNGCNGVCVISAELTESETKIEIV